MKGGGFFHGFSFGVGFELMRRVIVPVILVLIPLMLWWWLGPEKPKCDSARSEAARIAVAQVADRIRVERGDIKRAAVLHFANDPTDFVTNTLRERLMDGGLFDLDGTPVKEKIRNIFNFRNDGEYNVEEAIKYAKSNDLDAVIIGLIDRFETVKGKAELTGSVKFIKLNSGEIVEIPLTNKKILDNVPPPGPTESMSFFTRILLAAVCVFIIPVLVFPFLKLVMRKDSNMATAAVLIALLVIDGVIISIILGTSGTFFGLATFLIALAAAFGYDLYMLSYAQLCRPALPGTC